MMPEHREYTFDEWMNLTFKEQREIVNNYWNPYNPELGKLTRDEIIKAFRKSVNTELEFCEFKYFGFYADAIFVIPKEAETKLPTTFAGLTVNRGEKIEQTEDGEWKIKWEHSGTETIK